MTTGTMDETTIPTWYIPTFYGDIRLESVSDRSCAITTVNLTIAEREALEQLGKIACSKKWREAPIRTDEGPTVLLAPVAKVAKQLAKLLKPNRTIISAVRFSDGMMEEIRDSVATSSTATSPDSPSPSDKPPPKKRGRKPKAATSVAAPTRGCPPPDFEPAEIRARRVLAEFLSPEQLEDFQKHQRFITIGATTGNRYMLTSRHATHELAKYTRTLYDLDLQRPLCVHDWDIPPAEELLGIHVLLSLPGWERYLHVTDDNMEHVLHTFIHGHGRPEIV